MTDQTAAAECAFADEGCTCGRPRLTLTEAQARMAATPKPGLTFATYLDATERDQLDARAATAEAERDEALNDRDAYREARDLLRQQLDAMKAAKKRTLGRLEKAEHVIDLIRGGQEQIDRALAVYDTTPGETCSPPCTLPKGHQRECDANEQPAPRHPGDALADALRNAYSTEQLATLHEDLVHELDDDAPPENPLGRLVDALFAARWHQQPPSSVPPRRAQEDEPRSSETDVPDWVLMLVAGLARYEAEHPKLYRHKGVDQVEPYPCPCSLLEGVPKAIREQATP